MKIWDSVYIYRQSPVKSPDIKNIIVVTLTYIDGSHAVVVQVLTICERYYYNVFMSGDLTGPCLYMNLNN